MDDLISRQAAIALWDKYHPTIAVDAMEYDKALRSLPSAQPQRIRGRWKKDGQHIICDQCGEENDYAYDDRTGKLSDYFCPHCGADMRGEQE